MHTTETERPKLSQLARAGAKLHPQGNQMYCYEQDGVIHTCVLGAIYEALTGSIYPGQSMILDDLYHMLDLHEIKIFHPQIDLEIAILPTIVDLNDGGWTREEIADYLEERGY